MTDETASVILSDGEIAILNAARSILAVQAKPFPDKYGLAACAVYARVAEDAIFTFLNNADT